MELEGKRIWITGASSGIGEALAITASRAGARLILSARRGDELERVRSLCDHPERHDLQILDLADSDGFAALAQRLEQESGPIDILVNNAGISQRALAMDTGMDVIRQVMEVNYFGTVALIQAVLPAMIKRGQGAIVTVSSLTGKFATPKRSSYAASKHAILAYMDALRAELHHTGIAFTTICPGFIRTNLTYHALLGDGREQGTMDDAQAHGMAPEACARQIWSAVKAGRDEVYIGGREKYAVYLKRFLPGVFNRIIRTAKVT